MQALVMAFLMAVGAQAGDRAQGARYIPNFHEVKPGVARGGRPSDRDIRYLAQEAYRTVVNIENNPFAMAKEKKAVEAQGLRYLAFPLSPYERPDDEAIDAILALLQNSSAQPLFLHCYHGRDRTGLVIGLYRVLVEDWPAAAAYQEMLRLGFNPSFTALVDYFRERTGYEGPSGGQ